MSEWNRFFLFGFLLAFVAMGVYPPKMKEYTYPNEHTSRSYYSSNVSVVTPVVIRDGKDYNWIFEESRIDVPRLVVQWALLGVVFAAWMCWPKELPAPDANQRAATN